MEMLTNIKKKFKERGTIDEWLDTKVYPKIEQFEAWAKTKPFLVRLGMVALVLITIIGIALWFLALFVGVGIFFIIMILDFALLPLLFLVWLIFGNNYCLQTTFRYMDWLDEKIRLDY